jgi:hypothetical protein
MNKEGGVMKKFKTMVKAGKTVVKINCTIIKCDRPLG